MKRKRKKEDGLAKSRRERLEKMNKTPPHLIEFQNKKIKKSPNNISKRKTIKKTPYYV